MYVDDASMMMVTRRHMLLLLLKLLKLMLSRFILSVSMHGRVLSHNIVSHLLYDGPRGN